MTWNCPHLVNNDCIRLRKTCQPLQNGCVLEGKVQFVDNPLDNTGKKDLKNKGNQAGKSSLNYRMQNGK